MLAVCPAAFPMYTVNEIQIFKGLIKQLLPSFPISKKDNVIYFL